MGLLLLLIIIAATKTSCTHTFDTTTQKAISNVFINDYSSTNYDSHGNVPGNIEVVKIGNGFGVTYQDGDEYFLTILNVDWTNYPWTKIHIKRCK